MVKNRTEAELTIKGKNEASKDIKEVSKSLDELNDTIDETNDAVEKTDSAMSAMTKTAIAGVGIAVVGAFAAFGAEVGKTWLEIKASNRKIQQSLGTTRDEASKLQDSAKAIWAGGFAEMDEATDAIIAVRQNMRDLANEELEAVATGAITISNVFGEDVSATANSASALMKQFGLTSQEAMDFLASGFQKGLNVSDDFIDSIGEYSNQFASLGFSASEFFSIMQTGLLSGVLGTDKIADAIKEFGIRMQDGSSTTRDALVKLFGASADGIEDIKAEMATYTEAIEINEQSIKNWEKKVADSQAVVDDLTSALEKARGELAELANPNLYGMKEFDDAMFGMEMASKSVRLEMANMLDENSAAFQEASRQAEAHNAAIARLDSVIKYVENDVANAEKELSKWRDELKKNEDQAKTLESQLNEAKRALDNLSRPKLKGMEEYDEKLFQLEQQANKAKLAMVGMDTDSPKYEKAQANLDKINNEIEKLSLKRDIEFEPQLRAIEKAAADGSESAMSFNDVMAQIAAKKSEIGGIEKAIKDNDDAIKSSEGNVALWEQNLRGATLQIEKLTDSRSALGETTTALEVLRDSSGFKETEQRLAQINNTMERMQLGYDLEFAPQLRAISEAAEGVKAPALSFAQAMQGIADKKAEIGGIEQSLLGAKEALRQDNEALSQMKKVYNENKKHLEEIEAKYAKVTASAQKMLDGIRDGSISVAETLPVIIDALKKVDDKILQTEIGTALFGTQWEDSTAQAILAIDQTKFHIEDMAGSMEQMITVGISGGQKFTAIWRGIVDSIASAGANPMPIADIFKGIDDGSITATNSLPLVVRAIRSLEDPIAQNKLGVKLFGDQWDEMVKRGILSSEGFAYKLSDFGGSLTALGAAGLSAGEMMGVLAKSFVPMLNEYLPKLAEWIGGGIPTAIKILNEYIIPLATWIGDNIPQAITGAIIAFTGIKEIVEPFFEPISIFIYSTLKGAIEVLDLIISVIVNLTGVFAGVITPAQAVQNIVEDLKDVFGNIIGVLYSFIDLIFKIDTALIALIQPFHDIKAVIEIVRNVVMSFAGFFIAEINKITSVVVSFVGVLRGTITPAEGLNNIFKALGGTFSAFEGIIISIGNALTALIQPFFDIKSLISDVGGLVRDFKLPDLMPKSKAQKEEPEEEPKPEPVNTTKPKTKPKVKLKTKARAKPKTKPNLLTNPFGFADGGMFTGGKPIIVGERGPEMIVPRASGTVIPNEQLGGGRTNNVSLSINVQGNADSGTVAQIEAVLHRAIDQLIGQGNL